MEEIVYENEVLPELEIEELLTLEQMLAFQPRFVAFTEQDLLAYIQQLLKTTPQRAEIFARLHREVVENKLPNLQDRVVIAPYSLSRNDYEDANFVQDMNEAKQASSYAVQQMGIDRVMFPFQLEDTTHASSSRPVIENDVSIILQEDGAATTFPSRILKTDPAQVHVDRAKWKITEENSHPDYLFDTQLSIAKSSSFVPIAWNDADPSDIAEWILQKVRPSIQEMIAFIREPIDVHTLHRILNKYGYDLEKLNVQEFAPLQNHMKTILQDELPPHTNDQDAPLPIEKANISKNFVTMEDALVNETSRAALLTSDDRSMRMEEAYRMLLQSVPPLPQQPPLSTPAEMAKELQSGTSTFETIAEQLIQWYLRWFLDNLEKFMNKYHQNKVDTELVEKYVQRLKNIGESIMLTSTFDFIRQYSDVAELKEGNDTSMYDGAAAIVPQTVFEETENEEYVAPRPQEVSNDRNEESDALNLFDNINTDANMNNMNAPLVSFDGMELEQGQKEVFTSVWKQIHVIQIASGLPINTPSILQWCAQYIHRPSRIQQILAKVPGISEVVANRIVHDDIQVVSAKIQDLYSKQWRESLQQCYKEIHEEWVKSQKETLLLILTRWWIELCIQSLQGRLHFTPLQGMIQHIHLWSYYGPPMQPDAKSGILHYLMEVAESTIGLNARTAKDSMKVIANEKMTTDMDDIKIAWDRVQSSEQNLSRSDRARLLLENTIKALKSGQSGVDILSGYLPGIIYLPQLLPAKRVAKKAASWIQGCCAAPLDETFKADSDWRTQLSALYKIKRFLSKDRWSVQARSVLNTFAKDIVAHQHDKEKEDHKSCNKPVDASLHTLHDSPSSSELFGVNINDEVWQWIPRSHIDMLSKQPNLLEGWSKTLIEKMYPSEKNKSAAVFRVIQQITSISSLLSFINRIGKNIHEKIQDETYASILSQMKDCLRKIPSGKVSSAIILYTCTVVLTMPATIQQDIFAFPTNITRQEISSIWNKNYQVCVEWNQVGAMMNATEVQAFITKVREQQKEISLQRLDILSIEDRQILLDAKNLGLTRIVEFREIQIDQDQGQELANDAQMDIEGVQDFELPSVDADQDIDAL